MTLAAALSGQTATILFADTQETIGSYGTKTVNKLEVLDCPEFRVGITGSSSDANYSVMLLSEILKSLFVTPAFDLAVITRNLTQCLTEFYAKHIWPRPSDRPEMDYLLVVQPFPSGTPEVIKINETVANVVADSTATTVGIGSYLADYLFKQIFTAPAPVSRRESLSFLCAAGMYVANEIKENIIGVGPVERVGIFDCHGVYDELNPVDVQEIQDNFHALREYFGYFFADAMDVDSESMALTESTEWILEIRQAHEQWYERWNKRREIRQRIGCYKEPKRNVSVDLILIFLLDAIIALCIKLEL